ncbi:Leucine-rich repeat-containing protein, partial [Cynara cardunculus var. scolymus]
MEQYQWKISIISSSFHNIIVIAFKNLCELKNLLELDLSHNMFEGNLPHCFNSLSSLKLLDISSNQFTGTLPPSLIANLTSLEYVDFSDNKFEGAFSFSSFSGHTKLEQRMLQMINLSHNSLRGQFPNWLIENNTMLEALILRNNSFGGTISMPPHTHANLTNSVDGSIPSSIGDLSWLRVLDLSDNELSGEVPNGLFTNSPSLGILKLSKNLLHGM